MFRPRIGRSQPHNNYKQTHIEEDSVQVVV